MLTEQRNPLKPLTRTQFRLVYWRYCLSRRGVLPSSKAKKELGVVPFYQDYPMNLLSPLKFLLSSKAHLLEFADFLDSQKEKETFTQSYPVEMLDPTDELGSGSEEDFLDQEVEDESEF